MSLNKWYGYEFYDTFNNILVLFEDKPEYLEKKRTCWKSRTNSITHLKFYPIHILWEEIEIIPLLVIGIDCKSRYRFNYHSIKGIKSLSSIITLTFI